MADAGEREMTAADLDFPPHGVLPGSGDAAPRGTAFAVLAALSVCHLLNDMMQSLLSALYPVFKENYALTFSQVGLLAFVFQLTASLLQPVVGWYTDRTPRPRFLAISEFGPNSLVYHEGKAYRCNRAKLPAGSRGEDGLLATRKRRGATS